MNSKLWNRDFSLVVIGQIISLFGNSILRFALPLYLLNITGSSTIYGTVIACSTIPMIILSPIGGIFADRVNKRNIMVILDFLTTAIVLLLTISMGTFDNVVLVFITMILLYGIQGAYQPTVQASIPALTVKEHLLSANAIINQVNSLSGLIGPVIGGVLYGFWGIYPVLIVAICSFLFSAVMEIFIHIPYEKRPSEKNIFSLIYNDLKESIYFMRKGKPIIFKVMCIVALFNMFLTSMIIIGMPVLITQTLKISSQMYGYSQAIFMAGGLVGGLLVGTIGSKLKIQKSYLLLTAVSILILPIGIVFFINVPAMVSYITITVCGFLFMMTSTVFSIKMLVFVQSETPPHLIGKVMSCIFMFSLSAQPIGSAVYGILFDVLSETPHIIIFGVVIISSIISLASKKVFKNFD